MPWKNSSERRWAFKRGKFKYSVRASYGNHWHYMNREEIFVKNITEAKYLKDQFLTGRQYEYYKVIVVYIDRLTTDGKFISKPIATRKLINGKVLIERNSNQNINSTNKE